MLAAPAVIPLGFGLTHSKKHTLRLQRVRVGPAQGAGIIGKDRSAVAVETFIEHYNPSLISRFTERHELAYDTQHGAYVQDEHGNKYGYSSTAPDRKTWRRIGIVYSHVTDEEPMNKVWRLDLRKIPKSAGKLTFKAVYILHEEWASEPLDRLPIAVVVRQ